VNLPADRPFLLWVCSALFADSPSEARFVRRWVEELRASPDPLLSTASILVRPHPARLHEWHDVNLSDLPAVALHGSIPVGAEAKADYFESLYFSAAVAGLNTSAFLEAAIVGRPVHTIILPEFSENQEGTLHFPYLLSVGGGLLHVARDFDEHRLQLTDALREPARSDGNAGFVKAFIRPAGLDQPATDLFTAAVEDFGHEPVPAAALAPPWAPVLRLALWPLAQVTHLVVTRGQAGDRTFRELRRARRKEQHRRDHEMEDRRRVAEREESRQDKTRRAEALRQEELRRRQERIDASEREKRDRRMAKERAKLQRTRTKRRAALVTQIKRRIGFGRAEDSSPPE